MATSGWCQCTKKTAYNWCEIWNGCPGSAPFFPPIHPPNWHYPQCVTPPTVPVITKTVPVVKKCAGTYLGGFYKCDETKDLDCPVSTCDKACNGYNLRHGKRVPSMAECNCVAFSEPNWCGLYTECPSGSVTTGHSNATAVAESANFQ